MSGTPPKHRHALAWMRPGAPYHPVASVGLLDALAGVDPTATLHWDTADDPHKVPVLTLSTDLTLNQVGEAIAAAPWPDLDDLPWGIKRGQAIKPMLETMTKDGSSPAQQWRRIAFGDGATSAAGAAGARLVAALLTDGAPDGNGVPSRSRLLRGVKSDLSGVAKPPKIGTSELVAELEGGLTWTSGSSGLALGLAPQAQTFGGTTGPDPSSVGSYSKLLYRLCWLGIMAMPPIAVMRGTYRVVGGPLFASAETLSWPMWTFPLTRSPLVVLYGLAAIHAEDPDRALLRARGIAAVYRSRARAINSMVSVFGWGERVA